MDNVPNYYSEFQHRVPLSKIAIDFVDLERQFIASKTWSGVSLCKSSWTLRSRIYDLRGRIRFFLFRHSLLYTSHTWSLYSILSHEVQSSFRLVDSREFQKCSHVNEVHLQLSPFKIFSPVNRFPYRLQSLFSNFQMPAACIADLHLPSSPLGPLRFAEGKRSKGRKEGGLNMRPSASKRTLLVM